MRGYGEYCPVALGAEVLAERWTPLIVRNLVAGADTFTDILAGAPGLPRSVLAQRLRGLERAGVVTRAIEGRSRRYLLTDSGLELADVVHTLGVWGARWRQVLPEHHDPYLVLWTLAHLVDAATEPALEGRDRVVARFDLPDVRRCSRLWLVLGDTGNEVCVTAPGFEEDGVVTTDAESLVAWHCGRLTLADALRSGRMTVIGSPWLERALARWGLLSPFADVAPVGAG